MRAAQDRAADHGLPEGISAKHGLAGLVERGAATLFFTLFPSDCRICGSPLRTISQLPVCQECLVALHPLQGSYCAVCGEVLHLSSDNHQDAEGGETRCMLCQRADPPYERAVAYGSYDGQLRDLIHLLKFRMVAPAAAVLGGKLAGTIASLECKMPVGKIAVVAVPLYSRKRRQRGFNQAEMIAREAVRQLGRPKRYEFCGGILRRCRETRSQIGLTSHQRRENMRGAFAVSEPTRIAKRDILLIDDVLTTGTTASECARVLLRAGAARVWVATVARMLKMKTSDLMVLPTSDDLTEEGIGEHQRLAAHG